MPRRSKGFTLVELLVVIGIIALLIGMLLPALAGARRAAAAVKCAAHLRDLGNAIQIYANEHQYHIPTVQATYTINGKGATVMWYDLLGKYVFKSGIPQDTPGKPGSAVSIINDDNFSHTPFVGCPAFDYQRINNNATRTATGYGLALIPLAPNTDPNSGKFVFNQYPGTSGQPARFFKISEFKNPANRALMSDANGYGGIQAKDPDPITTYTPNQPGNAIFGDVDYYRHGRMFDLSRPSCNVLFADLHVDLCTPWAAFWAIRDPARKANSGN